jgi:hypothetical protein
MVEKEIQAKTDLAKMVLDSYRFEYKDYTAWWNDLDRKAQGTVAIAGIILAGALAFARQLSVNTPVYEKIVLSIAIVLLLCAIGFAVFTLIVRNVSLPPPAKQIEELAKEILSTDDSEIAAAALYVDVLVGNVGWGYLPDEHDVRPVRSVK